MKALELLTDDELVKMYAKGQNEAFDSLLERYKNKVYSYIFYTVHDEDTANDLFQETFMKVIVNIQSGRYAAEGKFQAWVTRIAHNMIMDFYRQRAGENTVGDESEDGQVFNNASLSDPSFESQQIHEQTLRDVKHLYHLLPQSQSEIVFMRFYQNLSFKEIADELGISINTALGRMRYAIINMRKMAAEKKISLALN